MKKIIFALIGAFSLTVSFCWGANSSGSLGFEVSGPGLLNEDSKITVKVTGECPLAEISYYVWNSKGRDDLTTEQKEEIVGNGFREHKVICATPWIKEIEMIAGETLYIKIIPTNMKETIKVEIYKGKSLDKTFQVKSNFIPSVFKYKI